MASYDRELLDAAKLLIARKKGQRGRLPTARVRRSISTAYYALFHFLLEEASLLLVGSTNELSRRRRIFVRLFIHKGVKTALDKIRAANIDGSVCDFLRPTGVVGPAVSAPQFARNMASAFADAQAKRHDADYDLNKQLIAADANLLIDRVEQAIDEWRVSGTPADRDFKKALCPLMLLKGQLRQEN